MRMGRRLSSTDTAEGPLPARSSAPGSGPAIVVEQAVAVLRYEAIDVVLIGRHDAERRLEVLARQREAMAAVVRRADDDEQRARRLLDRLLEGPGVGWPPRP